MEYFFISLILILLCSALSLAVKEINKAKLLFGASMLSTLIVSLTSIKVLVTGITVEKIYFLPEPFGKSVFLIDSLSAFFICLVSIMSSIICFYTVGYIKPYADKPKNAHFLFLGVLICSMLALVVIQNVLLFLVVWEIMTLASFFLVMFDSDNKDVRDTGINYLIYMHICVIFLMVGFIALTIKSNSLNFESFKAILSADKTFSDVIFFVLFVGFGIKTGFVPFHNWLPKTYCSSPTHITAIMSCVMKKIGIYAILRLLTLVLPSMTISLSILAISVITALFGIVYATAQKDIKKLLAYSSIENVGIIGIGIGLGVLGLNLQNNLIAILGFSGALLHVLNHSIFKEILFFCQGALFNQMHISDMEQLGGLAKKMPITSNLFLIGSIAICSLPPFNGFISEFLIYLGLLKALLVKNIYITVFSAVIILSISFVGAIAILCYTKVFSITFLGQPRSDNQSNVIESSSSIVFSTVILAIMAFLIGIFPQYFLLILLQPVKVLVSCHCSVQNYLPLNLFQYISLVNLVMIVDFLFMWFLRKLYLKNKSVVFKNTWACGFQPVSNKMQYSGSSYVSPFLQMLRPIFIKHQDSKKPKELFPKEAHYDSRVEDIEEYYIVKPIIHASENFLAKFQWLQGGHTQQYIIYGLIFLVIALVRAFFV